MATDKKLFAVLILVDSGNLVEKIKTSFPESYLELSSGQWFVVAQSSMTTTEVSEKLGWTPQGGDSSSSGVVLSVSNYYGRAPGTVWEWVAAKLGGSDGAAG